MVNAFKNVENHHEWFNMNGSRLISPIKTSVVNINIEILVNKRVTLITTSFQCFIYDINRLTIGLFKSLHFYK